MKELIKQIKEKIASSQKRTLESYNEEEEDITARFLENIKRDFEEIKSESHKIETQIFRRKGPKSEENRLGADFAIILEINNKKDHIKKYFLAQSKKCKSKSRLRFDKLLISQCEKMMSITSDSFVFVYTKKGIFVQSALNKVLAFKKVRDFFVDFVNCFIGEIHCCDDDRCWRHFPHHPFFHLDIDNLSNKMH